MVVEALAAVSLAGAVVQFVQFTTKVAQKGHEYHKTADGAIKEHIELREYAARFESLNTRLKKTIKTVSRDNSQLSIEERALIGVAKNCQLTCRDLCEILNDLTRSHNDKTFGSLRQALKSVWKEKKIEGELRKLRMAQEELVVHLLVVLQ